MLKYLVPNNTATAIAETLPKCANFGLILGRYLPEEVIQNSDVQNERNRKWRDKWLKERLGNLNDDGPRSTWTALNTARYQRWKATTADATRFQALARSRLVLGLGGESAIETGLTLQHVTGLPIIPGSALKGLCRAYGLYTIAASLNPQVPILEKEWLDLYRKKEWATPLEALDGALTLSGDEWHSAFSELVLNLSRVAGKKVGSELVRTSLANHPDTSVYRDLFGSTARSGSAIFYDGILVSAAEGVPLFELDVMTPHFPTYYKSLPTGNISPPTDSDSPNPILFVTVAQGTSWEFAIGPRRGLSQEALSKAVEWLKGGLREMGIGGKTAAGYGAF